MLLCLDRLLRIAEEIREYNADRPSAIGVRLLVIGVVVVDPVPDIQIVCDARVVRCIRAFGYVKV